MASLRQTFVVAVLLTFATASASPVAARSFGQVIDDTVITTEVKAKLSGDKLSNLTKIEVKTDNGIVTLNGTVDDPGRRARAAQIASGVNGVKGIVNNIHVAGSTVPAAPVTSSVPVPGATVDATGIVANVDPTTGTITLQDGRVLRTTTQTVVWQPSTIQGLRPGAHVLVRDAAPVGVQPSASVGPPEWRMGTVRSVDRGAGVLVLTDGTLVRVVPTALVRRGSERVTIDQIAPGSEVVIRALPPPYGGAAEGSALPGRMATAPTIDASEISVVWAPLGGRR
jgi:hyperosmotically inducible protein